MEDENQKTSDKKVGFWDWLINGTGTVAEPWTPSHEIREAKRETTKEIHEAFDKYQKQKILNGNS